MARLKSLNFQLVFHISFSTHPIIVKYKDVQVDKADLNINKIGQTEEITFEGFTAEDKSQKVSCSLKYDDRELDLQTCTTFQMQNNEYVENIKIENYKDIYFNGDLTLTFSKYWLRANILSGANLDTEYVNWYDTSFTDEEVFCVGDSYTYGNGVERHETWPSMLNGKVCNFGSCGLSLDGCLRNIKYIIENSNNVKKIICLLPPPARKLFEFEFLNSKCVIPITVNSNFILPNQLQSELEQFIKHQIVLDDLDFNWTKTCDDIIDLCNKNKIQCWLSSWTGSNFHDMIPNRYRLPKFPAIKSFTERANDNAHPHRKHYELFVKNIQPFVDKKQN